MLCEPDLITIRQAMCIMAHCNQIRLIYNTNKLLFKIEISAMVSLFIPQPLEKQCKALILYTDKLTWLDPLGMVVFSV